MKKKDFTDHVAGLSESEDRSPNLHIRDGPHQHQAHLHTAFLQVWGKEKIVKDRNSIFFSNNLTFITCQVQIIWHRKFFSWIFTFYPPKKHHFLNFFFCIVELQWMTSSCFVAFSAVLQKEWVHCNIHWWTDWCAQEIQEAIGVGGTLSSWINKIWIVDFLTSLNLSVTYLEQLWSPFVN